MAARATFALKAGVWFRRGRLVIVSPDSRATACPLSGRNSTYRPVQISETSSLDYPCRSTTRQSVLALGVEICQIPPPCLDVAPLRLHDHCCGGCLALPSLCVTSKHQCETLRALSRR